jgi:ribosomal protein S18 acetylase RimI-like enzyme
VGISIRNATTADAVRIAGFVSALGYPTSPAQMHVRLQSILRDDDYLTLVACDGEEAVGFVGARVGPLYESDGCYGQIMALAVAGDHQRHGIGRTLVQAAESLLMGRGVSVLVVTSGIQRSDAHAFYEKNGLTWTGRRYRKTVGDS